MATTDDNIGYLTADDRVIYVTGNLTKKIIIWSQRIHLCGISIRGGDNAKKCFIDNISSFYYIYLYGSFDNSHPHLYTLQYCIKNSQYEKSISYCTS